MTVYTPSDSLVGPIVHQISLIADSQIQGVTTVYEKPIDGPPEDGSVMIPLSSYKILDDTNGKLYVKMTFSLHYYVLRASYAENVATAYTYIVPFLLAYSAWPNQSLGGLAQEMTITTGGVTQYIEAGQVYVALITNIEVLTEFNIPTA